MFKKIKEIFNYQKELVEVKNLLKSTITHKDELSYDNEFLRLQLKNLSDDCNDCYADSISLRAECKKLKKGNSRLTRLLDTNVRALKAYKEAYLSLKALCEEKGLK